MSLYFNDRLEGITGVNNDLYWSIESQWYPVSYIALNNHSRRYTQNLTGTFCSNLIIFQKAKILNQESGFGAWNTEKEGFVAIQHLFIQFHIQCSIQLPGFMPIIGNQKKSNIRQKSFLYQGCGSGWDVSVSDLHEKKKSGSDLQETPGSDSDPRKTPIPNPI